MRSPVAATLSMHTCNVADAGGTHQEIPLFFPCSSKVKVLGMNAGVKGDMTLCLHRISTPAGLVPIPMPNLVDKGSLKVKFGGKPVARENDKMAHGGKISKGIPLIKIG